MQSTTTILRRGSQGQAVKNIQGQLNITGAKLKEDGIFGLTTEAAVKEFQKKFGLAVDGIVGPQTMNLLDSVTIIPIKELKSMPILRRGSQGKDVNKLQNILNDYGAKLVVDGIFGLATEAAVKKFQSEYGLTVDGIVGYLTWHALISPRC